MKTTTRQATGSKSVKTATRQATGSKFIKTATRQATGSKSMNTATRQATGSKFIETATRGRKKTLQAPPAATATKASCTHHWVIEPPNGAISVGKCRMCGERREFRNSYEYSSWYGSKNTDKPGA